MIFRFGLAFWCLVFLALLLGVRWSDVRWLGAMLRTLILPTLMRSPRLTTVDPMFIGDDVTLAVDFVRYAYDEKTE